MLDVDYDNELKSVTMDRKHGDVHWQCVCLSNLSPMTGYAHKRDLSPTPSLRSVRTASTTEDDQTKADLMLLAKKVEQQGIQIDMLKDQVLEVIKTATAAQVTTEMQLNGLLEDITHFCTDLQAICSSAEQQSIDATNTADQAYRMATEFKLKVLNNPAFN